MANTELLRKLIESKGLSITFIAKQLDITYVALNNKMKGIYAFTLSEALKIKYILNLTQSEWDQVFDHFDEE